MMNCNNNSSFKNIFKPSYLVFTILILMNLITNTNQSQIAGCEKEFFICNDMKCSKFGQCYYKAYKNQTLDQKIFTAECLCSQGYETYYPDSEKDKKDIVQCCYELKKLDLAFLYEVIIGFGLGYFYLEKFNFFFIKFIFQTSILCIVCFSGYCINFDNYDKKDKNKENKEIIYRTCNYWNFILIAIFVIWKIVDFFIFGLNLVKDSNDMRLYNEW